MRQVVSLFIAGSNPVSHPHAPPERVCSAKAGGRAEKRCDLLNKRLQKSLAQFSTVAKTVGYNLTRQLITRVIMGSRALLVVAQQT